MERRQLPLGCYRRLATPRRLQSPTIRATRGTPIVVAMGRFRAEYATFVMLSTERFLSSLGCVRRLTTPRRLQSPTIRASRGTRFFDKGEKQKNRSRPRNKKSWGTGIRTPTNGVRVRCANHYAIPQFGWRYCSAFLVGVNDFTKKNLASRRASISLKFDACRYNCYNWEILVYYSILSRK